jgi:hypothetical protein
MVHLINTNEFVVLCRTLHHYVSTELELPSAEVHVDFDRGGVAGLRRSATANSSGLCEIPTSTGGTILPSIRWNRVPARSGLVPQPSRTHRYRRPSSSGWSLRQARMGTYALDAAELTGGRQNDQTRSPTGMFMR